MNALTPLVACLVAAVALTGCSKAREVIGQTKQAPDEFAVYSRAPLSMPPEYKLRPPSPGSNRPQEQSTTVDARRALLGDAKPAAALPDGASPGLVALYRAMGALDVPADIRATVDRETSMLAREDESFTDDLLFWRENNPYNSEVDPAKEAKRIRENLALGKPITDGAVPVIERKEKALLEGILD